MIKKPDEVDYRSFVGYHNLVGFNIAWNAYHTAVLEEIVKQIEDSVYIGDPDCAIEIIRSVSGVKE